MQRVDRSATRQEIEAAGISIGEVQQRPDPENIRRLSEYDVATVHQAMGHTGVVNPVIKPLWPGMRVCGPALTCNAVVGDNLTLHAAIEWSQPGDVIVITMGEYVRQGAFGDIMALSATVRGVAGMVTDSSVRDRAGIREVGLPVFCAGVCVQETVKSNGGSLNQPVSFGGQLVRPGDLVVGDDDGIVIVPADSLEAALRGCQQRTEMENATRKQIQASGKTTWQLMMERRQGSKA